MNLDFVTEVWEALRTHIDLNERSEAADTLVNLLIDNNYEVEDIKDAFKDKEINKALKGYTDAHIQDEEYEEYEDDDQDEWD